MNYFYYDESPIVTNHYIIRMNHELLKCKTYVGAYQIIAARLLNISFASYLRLCRDSFGAELYGKKCYYVTPYFKDLTKLNELLKILNKRAEEIIK